MAGGLCCKAVRKHPSGRALPDLCAGRSDSKPPRIGPLGQVRLSGAQVYGAAHNRIWRNSALSPLGRLSSIGGSRQ
jgi:hypothetical protein